MSAPLRVLVVEDHLPDAELVIDCLKRAGHRCEWTRCDSRDSFVAALGRAQEARERRRAELALSRRVREQEAGGADAGPGPAAE
jgi:hypothetical protein